MSFSDLRDIFIGRVGAEYCVKSVLFLKSPSNVKEYLAGIHKVVFPGGDASKNDRWRSYLPKGTPSVVPIKNNDLSNTAFMTERADKLSFDISRFTEFLTARAEADDDVKPIMLHYSMIYLFDFFSRTWLKYAQNWGHGIKRVPAKRGYRVRIEKSGILPRAIDAFYFAGQSSLLSPNDDDGIGYFLRIPGERISKRIRKMKYSNRPEITLTRLLDVYERLGKIKGTVEKSNPILVGYVILFVLSSICRYNARDWFKIRKDRDLTNKFDALQYDFLYNWTPEILKQTILTKGLEKELSISRE